MRRDSQIGIIMDQQEMAQCVQNVAEIVKERTNDREDLIQATTAMYNTLDKLKTERP